MVGSLLFKNLTLIRKLLGLGLFFGLIFAVQARSQVAAANPPLTLCMAKQPTSALVLVARERGYFAREGLNLEIKEYPCNKSTLKGLLAGNCDLATTATLPLAVASQTNQNFKIIASLTDARDAFRIVAHKSSGITTPEDLRGKRVATQEGSSVHYFLHLFLLQHRLSETDIELSFLSAPVLPYALEAGEIDAIAMREPFVSEAQDLMEDQLVTFAEPGLYAWNELLVARPELTEKDPRKITALLRALSRAETFCRENPKEAQRITAEALAVPLSTIQQLWAQMHLELFLSQSLILTLEREAHWAAKQVTHSGVWEDFFDQLWPQALLEVAPARVSVIGLDPL